MQTAIFAFKTGLPDAILVAFYRGPRSSWPTARKRAAYLRVNDSREWGVAWAQRCHHRARTISIKRSTSSAVVANEVTRRTSVPSRAGMELLAGEGIAHG